MAAVPGRRRVELRGRADGRRPDPRYFGDERVSRPARSLQSLLWSAVAVVVAHRSDVRRWPRSPASTASSTPPGVCCSRRSPSARWSARPVTVTASRRIVLAAMTIAWGLRLATHIGRRTIGRPEDPRYAALLAKAKGNPDLYALRMVYLLQGVLAYLISAPGPGRHVRARARSAALGWVGVAVWLVGVGFEADRRPPAGGVSRRPGRTRARSCSPGCGATRGTRTTSAMPASGGGSSWSPRQHWPGVLTIPAPIIMTFLLTKGSGVRILDKHMSGRPGWAEYASRTSPFFPLPPRQPAERLSGVAAAQHAVRRSSCRRPRSSAR